MRLFDLEIDGQKYPACCGLRALAQIQKKYGSLSAFEKKLPAISGADRKRS